MRRLLAVLAGLVSFLPAVGHATCSIKCVGMLVQPDCSPMPAPVWPLTSTQWPAEFQLHLTAQCHECCTGSGGPSPCTDTGQTFAVLQASQPVAGSLVAASKCNDTPTYILDNAQGGKLPAGTYQLASASGTIVFDFDVVATPPPGTCSTSAQCGACSDCVSNKCGAAKAGACTKDSECSSGQTCLVDPAAPCKSVCKAPCKTSSDCGGCALCMGGQCVGAVSPPCAKNADCAVGQTCTVDGVNACKNYCMAAVKCSTAQDCGTCSDCIAGSCGPYKTPTCSKDADCGAGLHCKLDAVSPCQNVCESTTCKVAADCGACFDCSAGKCVGSLQLPACTKDADCGAGKVCSIQAGATCNNACVVKPLTCAQNADCGACSFCMGGQCGAPIAGPCSKDADCGSGKTCKIDSNAACKNVCVAGGSCTTSADCPACSQCNGGACSSPKLPACTQNSDCPAGNACNIDAVAACNNGCVPALACQTAAQCGGCTACKGGLCSGVVTPVCTKDSDCGSGKACSIVAGAACQNSCVIAAGCTGDADCPSCVTCVAGKCAGQAPVKCTGDAQCGAGSACMVNANAPCKNVCSASISCSKSADCATCQICASSKCIADQYVPCNSDAGCGKGYICKKDVNFPCKNVCAASDVCSAVGDCAPCQTCSAGKCAALPVVCAKDADCGADKSCKIDAISPCKNECALKPVLGCNKDSDCAACAKCYATVCTAASTGCSKDADCGGGQVCKADVTDPCQKVCAFAVCKTDADCPSCVTCIGGACTGQGTVVCGSDGDCGAGKSCKKDAGSPCANACVTTGCKLDGDCGPCGKCSVGVCSQLPAPCDESSGCGAKESCQLVPGEACKNACIPTTEPVDAGTPLDSDAGASDTGVEPEDVAEPLDASDDAELDTDDGPDTNRALTDAATQVDASDATGSDMGNTGRRGGDAGTEDGIADGGIDDTESEEPPAVVAAKKSSCTAGADGSGSAALACLLALTGMTVLRRRRSTWN